MITIKNTHIQLIKDVSMNVITLQMKSNRDHMITMMSKNVCNKNHKVRTETWAINFEMRHHNFDRFDFLYSKDSAILCR